MDSDRFELNAAEEWHFVQLMLDAYDGGFLTSNTFTRRKFDEIAEKLNHIFPDRPIRKRFNGKSLQNKYNRLRGDSRIYHNLRQFSGVSVNPENGAIQADPQQWAELCNADSSRAKFERKGLDNYEELTKLLSGTTASGDFRIDGNIPQNSDEERENEGIFRSPLARTGRQGRGGSSQARGGSSLQPPPTYEVGGSSKKSGKRRMDISKENGGSSGRSSKKSREEVNMMKEAAIEQWYNNQVIKQQSQDSFKDCFQILKEMNSTDPQLSYKATQYFQDATRREIFRLSEPEMRMYILTQ